MIRKSFEIILGFTCILLMTCSVSFGQANNAISYELTIEGLDDPKFDQIRSTFDQSSILITQKSDPLISISNLRSRGEADLAVMESILRARGYYNSEISRKTVRDGEQFNITISVSPGPLYSYGTIQLNFEGASPTEDLKAKIGNVLKIKSGDAADANYVIAAEANILNILPKLGYPFTRDVDSEFIVDHQKRVMNVSFTLNTGARQRMGAVKLNGLDAVDNDFIRGFITWPQNSYYDQTFVDDLRNRIIKSNLFSGVAIDIAPASNNRADITVNHIEAKHRTIGTSIGYSTAEGVGGEVSWTHRNFMGDGKRLKIIARASEIEQSLASLVEIPHFKRLDQTLSFEGVLKRQDTDAFFAYVVETRAGIERVITPEIALLANVDIEYSDVTDTLGNRDFLLVSFPIGARWDSSDNLLDPNRGLRASFITAPSYGIGEDNFSFLKSEFRASAYFSLTSEENIILALRTRIGSITGTENETLPATSRFFSGGGGSIRGYGFQRVGPLGTDNNPFGGRSVNEAAAEIRFKFKNNLGFVIFSEGGNVYGDSTPQFNDFRYAAGVGARYATGFGPVRFDIAFPLNKRANDSSFQIYISLGQAF